MDRSFFDFAKGLGTPPEGVEGPGTNQPNGADLGRDHSPASFQLGEKGKRPMQHGVVLDRIQQLPLVLFWGKVRKRRGRLA